MKKIMMFLLVGVLFLPISVFAKTTVLTESEYASAIVDPSISEIALGDDITLDHVYEAVVRDNDKTIDLNGYQLTVNEQQYITFGEDNRTYMVTDSVGTGRLIVDYSYGYVTNAYSGSKLIFRDMDYESIRGVGVFGYSAASIDPEFEVDNVFFYYSNNAPLSDGNILNIKYLKVLAYNQDDPIGFFNDSATNYLSDILTENHEIYLKGSLYQEDYSTTLARNVYFSEGGSEDEEKSIVVKLKDKCLVSFDYNGAVVTGRSRLLKEKNEEMTLDESILDNVQVPAGHRFDKFIVNGVEKELGDTIIITDDTTIEYVWEDIPDNEKYRANLENVNLGELDFDYVPDDNIASFRITVSGTELLDRSPEHYKIELTSGDVDAFTLWYNNAGSLSIDLTYDAGVIKPAPGLSTGSYKATMTLFYDPDGTGPKTWMELDNKTVEFSVKENPNSNPDPGPGPSPKLTFKDVPETAWYYNSVKEAYTRGIIAGYSATKFGPGDKVTRGQLVTFIWRVEGQPNITEATTLKDIKEGAYYTKAVKWASKNKVVNGYKSGNFGPNDPITRKDLAVILNNYAKHKGLPYTAEQDLSIFADYKLVKGGYAEPALKWAVKYGVMHGQDKKGKKYIAPISNTTRAEAAAMIVNFLNNDEL